VEKREERKLCVPASLREIRESENSCGDAEARRKEKVIVQRSLDMILVILFIL